MSIIDLLKAGGGIATGPDYSNAEKIDLPFTGGRRIVASDDLSHIYVGASANSIANVNKYETGGVFKSSNLGNSWTPIVTGKPIEENIACTSDGQIAYARKAGSSAEIHYFSNYGNNSTIRTFTTTEAGSSSTSMACTPNGGIIHMYSSGSRIIVTSRNSGASFTKNPAIPSATYGTLGVNTKITCSQDGSIIFLRSTKGILRSTDFGNSWTICAGTAGAITSGVDSIKCSRSGQYVIASGSNQSLISRDYGDTWTIRSNANMQNVSTITPDGKKMFQAYYGPYGTGTGTMLNSIIYSLDFGVTWDIKTTAQNFSLLSDMVCDAEGNKLILVNPNGYLYRVG